MVIRRQRPAWLDIAANRLNQKWTARELIGRALWELLRGPLFSWTPRHLWGWRRGVLRLFGAKIGREVHIYPTVKITIPWNLDFGTHAAVGDRVILYALGPITIGERTTVSQGAHICAGSHDYNDPTMPLTKRPIHVGDEAWICADAFVGPGVTIGARAIVGARAVAMRDVADDAIVVGNPARVIKVRTRSLEDPAA